MASRFSIAATDIHPGQMTEAAWDELRTDPATGVQATLLEIVEPAENLFVSEVTGMFGAAANIALAKPQVLQVVVWQAHQIRASNADVPVPKDIAAAKEAALKWARTTGQQLLAAEGTATIPGRGGVEYEADDKYYTMAKLDRL